MNHNIKTPLNGILLFVQSLEAKLEINDFSNVNQIVCEIKRNS